MKNIKNFLIYSLMLSLSFLHIHASDNVSSQDKEFPQHTTEKYIYNKSVTTRHSNIFAFGNESDGTSVTDTTSEDFFSNRVTRKRIQKHIEKGILIITKETWASRNPSYMTWINGALAVCAIAIISEHNAYIYGSSHVMAAQIRAIIGR